MLRIGVIMVGLLAAIFCAFAVREARTAEPAGPAAQKPVQLAQFFRRYQRRSLRSRWRDWKQRYRNRRWNDDDDDDDDDDRYGRRSYYGEYEREGVGTYGRYRTMCVRLCDGFYFPVNFSAGSSELKGDASECQSRCSMPAKLFVYRNPGQDIENMVDLSGKPYTALANAFRYRKELVPNCQCRPEPWSEAAKKMHEKYALQKQQGIKPAQPRARATTKRRYRNRSAEQRTYPRRSRSYFQRYNDNYYDGRVRRRYR